MADSGRRITAGASTLAVVVLLVMLVACGGDDGDEAASGDAGSDASSTSGAGSGDEVCTEDRVGGELTVGQSAGITGFDPTMTTGTRDSGGTELTALYDTLMRVEPTTAEVVPHVAESLEPNNDLSEWTLTLRDGVEFGNGDPLTADAVVASIRRIDGASVAAANFAALISDMEVVDDRTVVFHLDGPWGDFPYFLAMGGGMIVNTAVVDEVGAEAFNLDPPAGAGVGPFELQRYAPDEEVVMRAKDDYWGGPVCIETVRFITPGDDEARYEALQLGEIDVTVLANPRTVEQARDVDGRPGITGYGNANQLMINVRPGRPGADLEVRQAIAAAIDIDTVNERAYEGTATASGAVVHPDTPLFTDGIGGPDYDPDRARELVDEARAAGWDGRLGLLSIDSPTSNEVSLTVEGMLEAVGMDVSVENVPTTELIERVITDQNFDVTAWSLDVLPEAPWTGVDRNLRSDSPTNRTGYADADFDAALAELREASTVEARREAIAEVQAVWNETVPGVVYNHDEEFLTWGDNVHGVRLTREGVAMLDDAYVEAD
jgi:peptide/nickel transport system substrate-binding protein